MGLISIETKTITGMISRPFSIEKNFHLSLDHENIFDNPTNMGIGEMGLAWLQQQAKCLRAKTRIKWKDGVNGQPIWKAQA